MNAGVPLIEVTHGDGLGGSSVNYGFPAHTDEEYLGAVIPKMKQAKVSALLLPGIGTVDHLQMARDLGVNTIRVATHCTEADVSEQHITMARKLEMDTVGFLMMAHMNSAGRPGQAGQADGRLRRQLHLRHRLGRPPAAGRVKERLVRCVKR
jgi:4-hydroxy-2-oxovalerate/4-hydroxy-2-oxohexanoate aldolase